MKKNRSGSESSKSPEHARGHRSNHVRKKGIAPVRPRHPGHAAIHRLHQTIGNDGVARLFAASATRSGEVRKSPDSASGAEPSVIQRVESEEERQKSPQEILNENARIQEEAARSAPATPLERFVDKLPLPAYIKNFLKSKPKEEEDLIPRDPRLKSDSAEFGYTTTF